MGDTLVQGLTRRINAFAYDRETQQELSYLVEESAVRGGAAAGAIVEFALGEADMAWTTPAGGTPGQGAEAAELDETSDEDLGAMDGLDDDGTAYSMAGLVDPSMMDDDDDFPPLTDPDSISDDDVDADMSELEDELNALENDEGEGAADEGEGDAMNESFMLFPGEIPVY